MLIRIDHEKGTLEILRAAPESHARGAITAEEIPTSPARAPAPLLPGAGKLVLSFHSLAGELVGEVAEPLQPVSFVDQGSLDHAHGLQGGAVSTPRDDVRSLSVLCPAGAAYVTFERREVEGRRAISRMIARFHLDREPPATAALGFESAAPFPWTELAAGEGPDPAPAERASSPSGGGIVGQPEKLHGRGSPATTFTIVILGDGFQRSELEMFQARARVLTAGLLKLEPYRSHLDDIDVYLVTAYSDDSGVTNCPYHRAKKHTYYDVEGNWQDVGYAGYFGTPEPWKIWDAVELVAPYDQVELVIMLVNSAMYGGRGDCATHLAYVPIMYQGQPFISLAAHESAHAFGGLTDEYIGTSPPAVGVPLPPNVTTEADLLNGTVWWKSLAYGFELAGPDFRAVHELGEPNDPLTGRPLVPPSLEGMLGAFWGCAYIDPGPGTPDEYTDPRGSNYYRAMGQCRMRWLDAPYCRVCDYTLGKAIARAAGK